MNEMKCKLFYCTDENIRDNLCCFYCDRKSHCATPCLNTPRKCGCVIPEKKGEQKNDKNV